MLNESAFNSSAAQARTIQVDTGFLPALDDPRLKADEILFWVPDVSDRPLEVLVAKGLTDDPAVRAVVASALYSMLPLHPSDGYEILHRTRQHLVTAFPLSVAIEPAQLRWELHLAASTDLLERAVHVSRRLVDADATPDSLAVAARILFLVAHPSRPSLDFFCPSAFDPKIRRPDWVANEFTDLFTYVLATTVERRGSLAWTDPSELPASVLEATAYIEYLLKRVRSTIPLTSTQRAIESWCGFAQAAAADDRDKLTEVGRRFDALPAFPTDAGRVLTGSAAAFTCFAMSRNWAEASQAAKKWTSANPKDAQAARRLAEAHYKRNEISESLDAYEAYVRLREGEDDDWESSLLLHLGLEVRRRRDSAAALEAAAFSASTRPQAERLISWIYPWFDTLSPKARERWWVGVFILTSPYVADEIGVARWDQAADAFGEAVAFELKERVFRPFAASTQLTTTDEYWRRALAGQATLGQMIECLLQTRQPTHQVAKALSIWLSTNVPRLRDTIRTIPQPRLLSLARLRGQAQHGSVTEQETRQIFSLA